MRTVSPSSHSMLNLIFFTPDEFTNEFIIIISCRYTQTCTQFLQDNKVRKSMDNITRDIINVSKLQ